MNKKDLLNINSIIFQDIIDKTNRLEAAKNDLQKQVDGTRQRIKAEEEVISGIQSAGSKVCLILH